MEELKVCSHCGMTKNISEFYLKSGKSSKIRYSSKCKGCELTKSDKIGRPTTKDRRLSIPCTVKKELDDFLSVLEIFKILDRWNMQKAA